MAGTRQVGFLVAASPDNWDKYIKWFKAKLQALGNHDFNITFLPPAGAAGDANKIKEAAIYLAGNVEVIVTAGTQAALACKAATQANQTPFVFASIGDPAISGLTPQAGGNFTGGSNQQVDLVGPRVDEMVKPANQFADKFAVVGHDIEPITTAMTKAVAALAAKPKPVQRAPITAQDDIATFITGLKNQGVKSLYVCSDMLITTISTELNNQASAAGMRTMYEFAEHVDDHGGTKSYGVNFKDLLENAAVCVDKILSGTKAGDIAIFKPPASSHGRAVKKKTRAYPAKKRAAAPKKKKKKSRRGR
jgi:ABC-type uncharacterized transport system substrate-binding protein